jgi:hypothetical protein
MVYPTGDMFGSDTSVRCYTESLFLSQGIIDMTAFTVTPHCISWVPVVDCHSPQISHAYEDT